MNQEIINELKILHDRLSLSGESTFGRIILALTLGVRRSELFDMSDRDFVKHIQRVQLRETDFVDEDSKILG